MILKTIRGKYVAEEIRERERERGLRIDSWISQHLKVWYRKRTVTNKQKTVKKLPRIGYNTWVNLGEKHWGYTERKYFFLARSPGS